MQAYLNKKATPICRAAAAAVYYRYCCWFSRGACDVVCACVQMGVSTGWGGAARLVQLLGARYPTHVHRILSSHCSHTPVPVTGFVVRLLCTRTQEMHVTVCGCCVMHGCTEQLERISVTLERLQIRFGSLSMVSTSLRRQSSHFTHASAWTLQAT